MGVPLIVEQTAIGAIVIQSYTEENAYTQEDIDLLELIASNISQSIKQAQDFEEINLLNQALVQSPEAVIITNIDGVIEYTNPAFTILSGYTSQEALGKNPRMLKSGNQSKAFYKNLWKTITKGKVWKGELVNKHKDDHKYLVEANISAVKNKEGKITHYIGIEEDITEKRQLERDFINAFVEAQEVEKQAFGEDLHDGISQILAAESMFIDVLIKLNQDRIDGKAKFLTKVKELNLSAIEEARNISHGLMAKQLKEEGLIRAVEIICEDYNASRNIAFKFTNKGLKEGDISKEIKTNIFRITQEISTNIVRHAAATKAEISLSKTDQNRLKLVVKDNGVGIDLEKIKKEGKGAGLKNMERRITLLNGELNIDTTPNKGTCFTIIVPLESVQ